MPKSKKTFPPIQLQSYLNEPQPDGPLSTFTSTAGDTAATKEAAMREYLVTWEEKWKRSELDAVRSYTYRTLLGALDLIAAGSDF